MSISEDNTMAGKKNSPHTYPRSGSSLDTAWVAHGFSVLDPEVFPNSLIDETPGANKDLGHSTGRPKQQQAILTLDGPKHSDRTETSKIGATSHDQSFKNSISNVHLGDRTTGILGDADIACDTSDCSVIEEDEPSYDDPTSTADQMGGLGVESIATIDVADRSCCCAWASPACNDGSCSERREACHVTPFLCDYERPILLPSWSKLPYELKGHVLKNLIDETSPLSSDLPAFLEYAGDLDTQLIALALYNNKLADMKKERNELIADDKVLRSSGEPGILEPHFFVAEAVDDMTREPRPVVYRDKVGKRWEHLNEEMRCLGEQRNQLHEKVHKRPHPFSLWTAMYGIMTVILAEVHEE